MVNITYPPARPLSVGEILDLTFRIYRATIVSCLLFGALGVVASQLQNIYSVATGHGLVQSLLRAEQGPAYWVLLLVGALAGLVFTSAILLRQHAIITDAAVGPELAAALRRLPAVLLLVILYAVAAMVCGVLAAMSGALPAAARWVGLLLLLVPLGYVLVAFSCGFTALLIGGTGAASSLARSWSLTRGSFWRLTVIYSVGGVLIIVLYSLSGGISGLVYALLGRGDVAVVTAIVAVVAVAMGALATPFYTAMALAVFGDLSVRKEGADLAQRISAAA